LRLRIAATFALLAAPILCAAPAAATATLSCESAGKTLRLDFMASVGSDDLISNNRGLLAFPHSSRPALDFETGRWMERKIGKDDFRLRLIWGEDARPSADLILSARRVSDTDFTGRFRLERAYRGRVAIRSGALRCQLGY
jgi:hypothetical protein